MHYRTTRTLCCVWGARSVVCSTHLTCSTRRTFTALTRRAISTTQLSERTLNRLAVKQDRLMQDIHHTSQWGPGERWGSGQTEIGMSRLSLSPADKQARDWFVETTRSLGCTITIDAMGNIFAVRPGRREGAPTAMGSHLDTQPMGGRYDGVLGVLAGVEALRVLEERGVETHYPVAVVNWTNEEGARFPISMVSSGVWAGAIPLERAHSLREVSEGGRTMKDELEAIGYLGDVPASHEHVPLAAHFELHIEQGPILETSRKTIGSVVGVQAYTWNTLTITGRATHTGTTPFENRKDALLAAARMITISHSLAKKFHCLASTGILTLEPGSVNTVPGVVRLSLDLRGRKDKVLRAFQEELMEGVRGVAEGEGCSVDWREDFRSARVTFDDECIRCVEDSGAAAVGDEGVQKRMVSGAGHDSVFTSKRCPTAMIFVPCRGGLSHHPSEYCAPEDCAAGARTLLGAVVKYDWLRVKGGC